MLHAVTETVVDRGDDFGGCDRSLGGETADGVALADDLAAPDAAAREVNGPALRPVVATAGRIHAGRATELGDVADQRISQESALDQVFQQHE